MTVAADSGPGRIVVMASTEQVGCAIMDFNVKRIDGHPTIAWTSMGIVDGVTRVSSDTNAIDVRYVNYLAKPGMHPGRNRLNFHVGGEEVGSAKIDELRVFADDSGIEYSPLGPANVDVRMRLASKKPLSVGRQVKVAVTLRNIGERTATKIDLAPEYDGSRLRLVRATSLHPAELRPGQVVAGSLVFLARRPGSTIVGIGGRTSSNSPGDDLPLNILPRLRQGSGA